MIVKGWIKAECVGRDASGRYVVRCTTRWWHPGFWWFAADVASQTIGQPIWSPAVWFWAGYLVFCTFFREPESGQL